MSAIYKKNAKSCKNSKSEISTKYEINRIYIITNESLKGLHVVRTHEMKNLEEINFKIVMLESTIVYVYHALLGVHLCQPII